MLGDTPYQFRYATDPLATWPATPAEMSALIALDEEIWTVIRPDVAKAHLRAASIDAERALGTAGRPRIWRHPEVRGPMAFWSRAN